MLNHGAQILFQLQGDMRSCTYDFDLHSLRRSAYRYQMSRVTAGLPLSAEVLGSKTQAEVVDPGK
jgi:hypothetical protein